ncbi:hypothetical protein BpHYR1_030246 [Brachionus plicatilis]|uniref:Uncharacterized protein n=1 Tax=Brachionus plicatilis TaxID=10195 RepID=A0A3M7RYL2_BRAPC|nr:hypothetical protein BpHYR1_030246 [Brachionus plicatilis]
MFESKLQEFIQYPSKPYFTLLAVPFLFYAAKKYYQKWSNTKSNFYLINDLCLIKSILCIYQTRRSCLESELKQPYLLIDTNLKYKLSDSEYENSIIEHFLSRYAQSSRGFLIDVIIRKKFKELIHKKKKMSLNVITLEPRDINLLVFKILTGFLLHLFGRNSKKSRLKFKNFKPIFKHLMSINKLYSLDLFAEQNEVAIEYKKNFVRFVKALKSQFELKIDDFDQDPIKNFNFDYVKFLLIKKLYLDLTQISSALMTFLNDLTLSDKSELINEIRESNGKLAWNGELWKYPILDKSAKNYLISCLNMDLFLVKKNFAHKALSSGKEFNFMENSFIGINIGSVKKQHGFLDRSIYDFYYNRFNLNNPNNTSLLITKSLIFNLVKNLKFFQNGDQIFDQKIYFFNFYH